MKIIGYIATSADGYIATHDGSVDFLTPYQHIDCGYDQFIQNIDVVIMGRKTYEVICAFGGEWPYPKQQGFIVSTQSDLALVNPLLQVWNQGVDALAAHLKQQHGQAWVVGGTQLQSAFIEKKLLDSLEIYEMPVFLGDGIALFPASKYPAYARQALSAELIAEKVIKKVYYF